jgi:hypothetical protein
MRADRWIAEAHEVKSSVTWLFLKVSGRGGTAAPMATNAHSSCGTYRAKRLLEMHRTGHNGRGASADRAKEFPRFPEGSTGDRLVAAWNVQTEDYLWRAR